MRIKRTKKDMAKEIKKWHDSIYLLNTSGQLVKTIINDLSDYDHNRYCLHHFIEYQAYIQNPKWYEERGIKQKLIFISHICHEHIHNIGIKNLTDEEFEKKYKISRWKLIFKKKFSRY